MSVNGGSVPGIVGKPSEKGDLKGRNSHPFQKRKSKKRGCHARVTVQERGLSSLKKKTTRGNNVNFRGEKKEEWQTGGHKWTE